MSGPGFCPDEEEAVVISLPRYHDQGHTSLVICLKICYDENKEIAGVSGRPCRLHKGDGSHIWSDEELRDNNIQVESIISYRRKKVRRSRHYLSNTGKKLVSLVSARHWTPATRTLATQLSVVRSRDHSLEETNLINENVFKDVRANCLCASLLRT